MDPVALVVGVSFILLTAGFTLVLARLIARGTEMLCSRMTQYFLPLLRAHSLEARATTTSTGNTNRNAVLIGTPLIQPGPLCNMQVTLVALRLKRVNDCTSGWMR